MNKGAVYILQFEIEGVTLFVNSGISKDIKMICACICAVLQCLDRLFLFTRLSLALCKEGLFILCEVGVEVIAILVAVVEFYKSRAIAA